MLSLCFHSLSLGLGFFHSAQVTCVPAELLTAEGLLSIPRGSQWRLLGAVSLFVFTLSQAWACFLCRAYRDRRLIMMIILTISYKKL